MAGLSIFQKKYTVRRFGEQEYNRGYASSPYTDFEVPLNVQISQHETSTSDEGGRQFRKLKSYGTFQFRTVDQHESKTGDWLFYMGQWYCCTSVIQWDHTLLHHNKAEWSSIGETESDILLTPPNQKEVLDRDHKGRQGNHP